MHYFYLKNSKNLFFSGTSQVVTKINVTKSRLHCTQLAIFWLKNCDGEWRTQNFWTEEAINSTSRIPCLSLFFKDISRNFFYLLYALFFVKKTLTVIDALKTFCEKSI